MPYGTTTLIINLDLTLHALDVFESATREIMGCRATPSCLLSLSFIIVLEKDTLCCYTLLRCR